MQVWGDRGICGEITRAAARGARRAVGVAAAEPDAGPPSTERRAVNARQIARTNSVTFVHTQHDDLPQLTAGYSEADTPLGVWHVNKSDYTNAMIFYIPNLKDLSTSTDYGLDTKIDQIDL